MEERAPKFAKTENYLSDCVNEGDSEGVQAAEARKENVNIPLIFAILEQNTEMSLFLIGQGADVDVVLAGMAPLHYAAMRSHRDVVAAMCVVPDVDLNVTNPSGYAPVHFAILGDNVPALEVLLRHGANPSMTFAVSPFPLLLAATRGCTDAVRLLLHQGVIPDTISRNFDITSLFPDQISPQIDVTALFAACENGYFEICKLLIDHGANVDFECPFSRRSCIVIATEMGHDDIVFLLLERGANHNICDGFGRNAADMARLHDRRDLYDLFNLCNTVRAECAVGNIGNVVRCIIDEGALPVPLAQFYRSILPESRAQIADIIRRSLQAETAIFSGLFNETVNEETSMQSEVFGPVAEEMAAAAVFPLAGTRRTLREIAPFFGF